MFCPKCGAQNDDNAFRCVQCGTVIQVVPPPIPIVKKNNALPIILIAVLGIPFLMFVVGIIAAIAVPLFTRLHDRATTRLILDVKVEKAVENRIGLVADELMENLLKNHIRYQDLLPKETTGIDITLLRDEDEKAFKELMTKNYPDFDLQPDPLKENAFAFHLLLQDRIKAAIKKMAYDQTLALIQNRVKALGIRNADIQRQKETQIQILLPKLKNLQKAIDLITKTGLLEFKLVDDENMKGADWQNNIPPGDQVLYETETNARGERTKRPWLLKQRAVLTGKYLKDAHQSISSQDNRAYVSLSFDAQGARKLEQITGDNIGKKLAIVLDDVVYSAPVIQDKIAGGNAVITGNFTDEEAKDLATILKTGALPVPVEILEKPLFEISPEKNTNQK